MVTVWLLSAACMVYCTKWLVGWWFVSPQPGNPGGTLYKMAPWLSEAETALRGGYQVKYYVIAIGLALAGAVLCSLARPEGRPPRPWQHLRTKTHRGIICLLVAIPLALCSYEASRPLYGIAVFGAAPGTSYTGSDYVVHGNYVVRRVRMERLALSATERQAASHATEMRTVEAVVFGVIAVGLILFGVMMLLRKEEPERTPVK